MNKRVKRLLWGDLSNIEECEAYFSDMSREGLHLEEIGRFFLYFKEGEAKNLNYRIDLAKKDEKKMKIQLREDKGWNFIGDRDTYLIFSSKKSSELQELYSNPEAQRLAIINAQEGWIKNPYINSIFQLLGIFILMGIVLWKINISNGIYLAMTQEHELYAFLIFTAIPFLSGRSTGRNLKRVTNILDTGEFLRHEGDYHLMNGRYIIKKLSSTLIILLLIIITFNKISKNESINLNSVDDLSNLPMITIGDIEDRDYKYEKSNIYQGNHRDYTNMLYEKWNVLIPKEYTLVEELKISRKGEIYNKPNALLVIDYYEGRFDFIAQGLERDILERENINYGVGLKKIQTQDNIGCYGVENNDGIYLLIRKDKQLVFLKYSDGEASMEEIIERSLEKL